MTDPSNPQTDSRERGELSPQAWWLWKGPALVWLALVVLFGITLGVAYLPLGGHNLAAHLAIAAIMIVLLVTFLMDMRNATAIVRLIGGAGLFWLIFMFSLTFNDYLSRYH
ncbi:MAG: Caa(3)-type oxidase subunit IV [Xanthobacteraceae bacterium]